MGVLDEAWGSGIPCCVAGLAWLLREAGREF